MFFQVYKGKGKTNPILGFNFETFTVSKVITDRLTGVKLTGIYLLF